jgi:hypothetical protein
MHHYYENERRAWLFLSSMLLFLSLEFWGWDLLNPLPKHVKAALLQEMGGRYFFDWFVPFFVRFAIFGVGAQSCGRVFVTGGCADYLRDCGPLRSALL